MSQIPSRFSFARRITTPGGGNPIRQQQRATAQSLQQQNELRQRLFDALLGGEGGQGGLLGGLFGGDGFDFENFGAGRRAEIESQFDEAGQSALANLSQRGLGSSSLVASTGLGVEREKQRALGNLEDQLLGQQLEFGQRQQQLGTGLLGSLLGSLR